MDSDSDECHEFLDNMDGLSAGIGLIASSLFAGIGADGSIPVNLGRCPSGSAVGGTYGISCLESPAGEHLHG